MTANSVALIGMSIRVPGAADYRELWDRLAAGDDCLTRLTVEDLVAAGVPASLWGRPEYVPVAGILADAESFDHRVFGLTPREASAMDPQCRVLLECAWQALEDGGYVPGRVRQRTAVFVGVGPTVYRWRHLEPALGDELDPLLARLLNDKDFVPAWIAYKLDLTGPAVAIQTACSTSLTAVHVAMQSLLARECDLALAGGATVRIPQTTGYVYREGGIESRDGTCRPFDADASGTVGGSGAGAVLLKRTEDALRDGDPIHALVLATAMNNDGARRQSFTAPNVAGQTGVMVEAWAAAGVEAADITYIEAHGTGTPLGDAVELQAIADAMRGNSRAAPCYVGSVKSNLGHLDAAAGIAGLAKAVLALKHQLIPATAHYRRANPRFDLDAAGLRIADRQIEWTGSGPRLAGVNSFGMGGTNVHALLAEGPRPEHGTRRSRDLEILFLSAQTDRALDAAVASGVAAAGGRDAQADLAHTMATARPVLPERAAVLLRTGSDDRPIVRGHASRDPAVIFLFPGQGQNPEQALPLEGEQFGALRSRYAEAGEVLTSLGIVIAPRLIEASSERDRLVLAQVLPLVAGYGFAELLAELDVRPDAALGHSLGELVAVSCLGGLGFAHAVELVARRALIMAETAPAEMVALAADQDDVRALLPADASIAAVNSAGQVIVAGPGGAIGRLSQAAAERGIAARRLATSRGFHSAALDPVLAELRALFIDAPLPTPSVRIASCLTGSWLTPAEICSADYWCRQARSTVQFAQTVDTVRSEYPDGTFVEFGWPTVSSHVRRRGSRVVSPMDASRRTTSGDEGAFAYALAELWVAGVDVRRSATGLSRRRVHAPTYHFDRQRHWVDAAARPAPVPLRPEVAAPALSLAPDAADGGIQAGLIGIWIDLFGNPVLSADDDFFELGGNSLIAIELAAMVRSRLGLDLDIAVLFDAPTVRSLAERLVATEGVPTPTGDDLDELLDRVERAAGRPDATI